VSEEERSFALGMQFVIFRLFGYIPAPILFGNLIDSTCLLWKSTCGSKGGRCLLYDIEQFRYRYVGLCAGIKILALGIFVVDWWLVRRRKQLDEAGGITTNEIVGSIISLDKCESTNQPSGTFELFFLLQCSKRNPTTNPVTEEILVLYPPTNVQLHPNTLPLQKMTLTLHVLRQKMNYLQL
jgi:hypothetical protein